MVDWDHVAVATDEGDSLGLLVDELEDSFILSVESVVVRAV